MWHRIGLLVFAAGLAACGSEPPPPAVQPDAAASSVIDDQVKALEKAQAVADQERERQRKMDEQLDGG